MADKMYCGILNISPYNGIRIFTKSIHELKIHNTRPFVWISVLIIFICLSNRFWRYIRLINCLIALDKQYLFIMHVK